MMGTINVSPDIKLEIIPSSPNHANITLMEKIFSSTKDIDYREVARLLRYLDKIVKIPPLVALTINDGSDIQNKNFDDCLFKPLNLKKLVDIIDKRCN